MKEHKYICFGHFGNVEMIKKNKDNFDLVYDTLFVIGEDEEIISTMCYWLCKYKTECYKETYPEMYKKLVVLCDEK